MDMERMHDMRLAVQLIQSSAQLLAVSAGDGDARGYLETLTDAAAQLGRLLEAALTEWDRRDAGPLDIVDALRTLCARCAAYADARKVRLRFASNVDALWLVTEGDRFRRVALNLVMNALRFSPAGGTVGVRCTALGDFAEIAVTDSGPGIPPECLPYIFLRGETDGGTGHGLPDALDGARSLGGTLSARSIPGRGSTFILRIPVRGQMVS